MHSQNSEEIISINKASKPTIQDEVFYEVGKQLLLESVNDSRNYCRQMINVAIGAIPVYLAILKLWFPDVNVSQPYIKILLVTPVFLFMLSILSFSSGYLPREYQININNLNSIKEVRLKLMNYRSIWGFIGFFLLCMGIITGVIAMLITK